MTHVCFVSWYAYPLFEPINRTLFGGSEVRGWLLGTGLAREGRHRVSFVVFDHGQGIRDFGAVRAYPHSGYRWNGAAAREDAARLSEYFERRPGFPYLRVRKLELPMLWRIPAALARRSAPVRLPPPPVGMLDVEIPDEKIAVYRELDADVYCGFGVGHGTAEVAAYCRQAGKRFLLFTGTDEDFSPAYRADSRAPNAYGSRADICHFLIMHADAIVTQTKQQQRLLKERFGRDSTVLANPAPPGDTRHPSPVAGGERYFLWVGKSDGIKRPDLLFEAARRCPLQRFVMVMNKSDPDMHARLLADCPPNARIVEWVSFQDMAGYYANALALVNTSRFEGFANAFLQAGQYGVPVISLQVDPDAFIETTDGGIVAAGSLERLVDALEMLAGDERRRLELGGNLRRQVLQHHALDEKVVELAAILDSIASSMPGHARAALPLGESA